jgi:hypothetical protein
MALNNTIFMHSDLFYLLTIVDGIVLSGIERRFIISLHQPISGVANLRKPLNPACTISCVVLFLIHV